MATATREEIRIGQLAVRFLVEGKDSGGSVAIFEIDVPAGARVPIAHSHDAYEETVYGIEGILTFTLEGRKIEIGPGDALLIPRGAVHRFDNLHSATSKTLAIVTPGILTPDYFREIAAIAKAAATSIPPSPTRPESPRRSHAPPRPHPRSIAGILCCGFSVLV
jgi:quercetin dioxygenase-like cupin family protein